MNLENIPFEVQKVWVYQSLNQPVGLELYKEIESIIKKYPQYFEWDIYESCQQHIRFWWANEEEYKIISEKWDKQAF